MRTAECTSRALAFVIAAAAATATPAKALTITPTYDANWLANAPAGAYADVNNVISQYETSLASNPSVSQVNVNIQFDWGDIAGSSIPASDAGVTAYPQFVGAGTPAFYSFNQVTSLLTAAAAAQPLNTALATAVANLPASNPFASNQFFIPDAQYLALTGHAQNSDTINAYVGVGTNPAGGTWNYSGGPPPAGQFDFTSTLQHEVAHAMGRVDTAFTASTPGGAPPFLTPLDLFKYNPGTSTLNPNFSATVFSIDKGATPLQVFSNTGDSSDWLVTPSSIRDSYASGIGPGVFQIVSPTDFTEMKSLGWDPLPSASHQLSGFTIAPNWAFGSPQTPIVSLCTTVGATTCQGSFNLGPLDSVFDFTIPSAGATTEASFAAIQELLARGLLESGDDGAGDYWNLTIPNAVWLGSASYNLLTPNQPPGTVADSITFANIGGLAHILWANGTDPPGSLMLPTGYLDELGTLGLTPTDVDALGGLFGNGNIPPPQIEECIGNFSASICDQALAGNALPTVPEPSSLPMLAAGLAGLACAGVWRRRVGSGVPLHVPS
jgi:hypothetical protein